MRMATCAAELPQAQKLFATSVGLDGDAVLLALLGVVEIGHGRDLLLELDQLLDDALCHRERVVEDQGPQSMLFQLMVCVGPLGLLRVPADIEDDVRERFGGSSELGRGGVLFLAATSGVAGALLLLLPAGLGRLGAGFGLHVPCHRATSVRRNGGMMCACLFLCRVSLSRDRSGVLRVVLLKRRDAKVAGQRTRRHAMSLGGILCSLSNLPSIP